MGRVGAGDGESRGWRWGGKGLDMGRVGAGDGEGRGWGWGE